MNSQNSCSRSNNDSLILNSKHINQSSVWFDDLASPNIVLLNSMKFVVSDLQSMFIIVSWKYVNLNQI